MIVPGDKGSLYRSGIDFINKYSYLRYDVWVTGNIRIALVGDYNPAEYLHQSWFDIDHYEIQGIVNYPRDGILADVKTPYRIPDFDADIYEIKPFTFEFKLQDDVESVSLSHLVVYYRRPESSMLDSVLIMHVPLFADITPGGYIRTEQLGFTIRDR